MLMTKDPNDVLDYAVDWAKELTTYITDTISTSTWTVPAGLTQATNSHTTTLAVVWLSGGVADTEYQVTNRIVTAGGRTYDRTLVIHVQER